LSGKEVREAVDKIEAITKVLEEAGIRIEGCKNVKLLDNVLVNRGIEIEKSEEVLALGNKAEDSARREIVKILRIIASELEGPKRKDKLRESL